MYSSDYNSDVFSGGGFMPSQTTTTAHDSSSSRKSSASQNTGLLPLTVKQISQAMQNSSDDTLLVDGQDVTNVTLVGIMACKEERSTDITFVLDDGTGRAEVKRWIDAPDAPEALELHAMQNGQYVRTYGHIRSFQNKKTIVAFAVKAITDFNEITFHFLECIHAHLHNLKSQEGREQRGMSNVVQAKPPAFAPIYATKANQYESSYAPLPVPPTGSAADCQRRVLGVIEEPANMRIEQGLHVDDIASRVSGFSKKQVRDALDFWINEGNIYSTIDDDHYKSTKA